MFRGCAFGAGYPCLMCEVLQGRRVVLEPLIPTLLWTSNNWLQITRKLVRIHMSSVTVVLRLSEELQSALKKKQLQGTLD